MKKSIAIFIGLTLLGLRVTKAQTGLFSANINFNGTARTLTGYVPSNLDSTKSSKLMICLHGAGDNSSNYMNALLNTFHWQDIFQNTIFICPDGGSDNSKDFYQPKGDQEIITQSILYAKNKYKVDSSEVVLQGFSLGGRSALKFGLENPTLFKGLLLNTPAIQGISDLENNPISSLVYNYENAKNLPIFISVGNSDYGYAFTAAKLASMLKLKGASVQYEEVSGLAHSIPSNPIVKKCLSFFETQSLANFDADLIDLSIPKFQESHVVNGMAKVQNSGNVVLRNISINVSLLGINKTHTWSGILKPHQIATIPISIEVNDGGYAAVSASIVSVNGQSKDSIQSNNNKAIEIEIWKQKNELTLNEGFESDSTGWIIDHTGSLFEWYMDPDVKKTGSRSMGSFNTIYMFYTQNYVESFSSPFINIAALANKELSFDLSYNYNKFTAPYFSQETYFADTLQVSISTDFGKSYTHIYKKGGKELATAKSPILNPQSVQSSIFTPKASEWRKEIVDLSAYSYVNNAIFKFSCISAMGGCINIDNINAGSKFSEVKTISKQGECLIYPNPAADELFVKLPNQIEANISLFDQKAKLVLNQEVKRELDSDISLSTVGLPEGFYILQIQTENQTSYQKILIKR